MINVKNIKIGSLIKLKYKFAGIILKNTNPLKRWDSFYNTFDLAIPLLVLDYNEGIVEIHGESTKDIKKVFCVRILVMANANKFWIVLSSTNNTGAIYLPEDLKSDFRLSDKIELIEVAAENNQ